MATPVETELPYAAPTEPHPIREAFLSGDTGAIRELLTPDVVLRSPITPSFRFEGREEVGRLFEDIVEAIRDVRYTDELTSGNVHVLVFEARTGRTEIQGVDVMRLDDEGRIREMTVLVRPFPGLAELTRVLGGRLARRRGRLRGVLFALMTAPVAFLIRFGDPVGAKLARPPRQGGV